MGEKEREEKVTRSIVSGSFFVRVNHQLQLNSSFCSTCHKLYRKDIYRGWLAIERAATGKNPTASSSLCVRSIDPLICGYFSLAIQHNTALLFPKLVIQCPTPFWKRGGTLCVCTPAVKSPSERISDLSSHLGKEDEIGNCTCCIRSLLLAALFRSSTFWRGL